MELRSFELRNCCTGELFVGSGTLIPEMTFFTRVSVRRSSASSRSVVGSFVSLVFRRVLQSVSVLVRRKIVGIFLKEAKGECYSPKLPPEL